MNGLLLLARGVEASLILSAYMSTLRNHWSPSPISSFPPRYRLKMPHTHKVPNYRTHVPACTVMLFKKQKSTRNKINQRWLFMLMCPQEVPSIMGVFPSPSFCTHYVLNGNHGNKGYEYDKICCILCENLIRIENLKESVE